MRTVVLLEGGRGCPYNCTFCSTSSFWGGEFRIKPLDVLLNEMNKFNAMYGSTDFDIVHDLFTLDRQHIKEFCLLLIKENWGYKCYT